MHVETVEDDLLLGTFTAGLGFAGVRQLFLDWEQAVEGMSLSIADGFEREIEALGVHIESGPLAAAVRVYDVQIWSDGGMSCRLKPFEPKLPAGETGHNGVPIDAPPSELAYPPAGPGAI
jgi:hypothetical protein